MLEWQLGLRGVRGVYDTLGPLLEARNGLIESGADDTLLVASFTDAPDLSIIDALGAWLANLGIRDAQIVTRTDEDGPWQESWRAVFDRWKVSDRLWVTPVWQAGKYAPDGIEVILDPTEAFGAGAHPTTRAVLHMLDACLAARPEEPAPTLLDVGTGTGILAIAAALLGADAVGVEIDPHACADARNNARLNGVADRVRVFEGSMGEVTQTFDIVVANIFASVLTNLAGDIRAAATGDLILSGMLESEVRDVLAVYSGTREVARIVHGGWVTVHLRVAS